MTNAKENLLLLASSEEDANLYYASQFLAPDPFIWMQIRGKRYLIMSDLEIDRARAHAKADRILSYPEWKKGLPSLPEKPTQADMIAAFARKLKVRAFGVPSHFPLFYAEALQKKGVRLYVKPDPFFEERLVKTPREVRSISRTLRQVERSALLAVNCLKASVIRNGKLFYRGQPLTSEFLRKKIHLFLMEQGCLAERTIVSSGNATVFPHEEGTGVLPSDQPIILDIFPKDLTSRYYADFTRTFVRGNASEALKKMYRAVLEAQKIAFRMIKPGINASHIHQAILNYFESLGFKTGVVRGKIQGFFHGTGHGLGLELHERPSIGMRNEILRAGEIITVEPGLYYPGIGGVRLEDLVLVTRSGCKNLTRFPKVLEI